ncbi:MAG: GntR family transcriptional regulator, partial [Victivallales bacterium]|nr:GntR family transcriptional regulator [Victivallales bacterium]
MSRNNKYFELIGKLENKIFGMAENTLLPPEQQLANEFGVSKPTLRRALQLMVEAGLLRKLNGIGVAVVKTPASISRELIFLCHDIEFFAETLKYFGILALDANYFVSIVPLSGSAQTQERIILSTLERRPAGVVVYADPRHYDLAAFHRFAALNIPALYLMRLPRGIDGNLLEFDNVGGITEIVEIFYRDGCRRIALYVDIDTNPAAAEERENGFRTGMEKCRLKIRPEYYCSYKSSRAAREKFLELFSDAKTC